MAVTSSKSKPTICQLCGKSDDRVVEMFVGGYVNWAHKECAEIGERVIRLWREHQEFLNRMPSAGRAMMDEMDLVFKKAKEKAIEKSSELGNTPTPWKDFTPDWLRHRLAQEYREWEETRDIAELLDIINLAAFVYLANNEPTCCGGPSGRLPS